MKEGCKVYIYSGEEEYSPDIKSQWTLIDISWEDAIKKYAGNKTIQLHWEEDSSLFCITIPSFDSVTFQSNNIAKAVVRDIKDIFKSID